MLERRRNGELYEARSRLDEKVGSGQRLSEGVVGRLVDLLDAEMVGAHFRLPPEQCATVQSEALYVIDNICVANTYVSTAQDRFVEAVLFSHSSGRTDAPSRLIQLLLCNRQEVRVMAAKVVANILAGTTHQIERTLSNDCTCRETPIGKVVPIFYKWMTHRRAASLSVSRGTLTAFAIVCAHHHISKAHLLVAQGVKHSVDLVTFAGMHLDPTEYHGESLDEVEEATRAICNASWGSFEQLQLLVKSDCVEALLVVLARVRPPGRPPPPVESPFLGGVHSAPAQFSCLMALLSCGHRCTQIMATSTHRSGRR